MKSWMSGGALALTLLAVAAGAATRGDELGADRRPAGRSVAWMSDIDAAWASARATGKPIFAAFR